MVLMTLIPEVVRGVLAIIREHIAANRAEEERKKAEAEAEADKLRKNNNLINK
jgi:hypothetical protein